MKHLCVPNRELTHHGDWHLRECLSTPEVLESAEHRQDHVSEKRRQRHPDERLGKFAPGHEVVINPRNGEMVLPGRHLGHTVPFCYPDAPGRTGCNVPASCPCPDAINAVISTSSASTPTGTIICTLVCTTCGPNTNVLIGRSRRSASLSARGP